MFRRAANGVANAGFGLAAALVLLALPRSPAPARACDAPVQAGEEAGRTTRVACGAVGPPLRGATRLLFGLKLDLNCADAAALEALPGIGPTRAAAIVRERSRRAFDAPAELSRVPGIGALIARRLAPWLAAGTSARSVACRRP